MRFNFIEEICFVQIGDNLFAGVEGRHALIGAIEQNAGAFIEDVDDLKVVPFAGGKIVEVVGWGDFDRPGTKFKINEFGIADDGDLSIT